MESEEFKKLALDAKTASMNKKWDSKPPKMFEGKVIMPFERALIHMREGRKVQLVGYDNVFSIDVVELNYIQWKDIISGEWILID